MLQKNLSPEDVQFRKLVESLDGHQRSIGEALGIDQRSVTKRLLTEKHAVWWMQFKASRAKRRRRERRHRGYENQKRRTAEAEAALHNGKAADAILLRALMEGL